MKITKYKASQGTEYFLEIVNKNDILFGLLRLRIGEGATPKGVPSVVGDVNTEGIIREIHIYGQSLKLGEEGKISQHKGLGKEIVKENKIKKLKIISGIGVREYYKKLGYKLEKSYMVKSLNSF